MQVEIGFVDFKSTTITIDYRLEDFCICHR